MKPRSKEKWTVGRMGWNSDWGPYQSPLHPHVTYSEDGNQLEQKVAPHVVALSVHLAQESQRGKEVQQEVEVPRAQPHR